MQATESDRSDDWRRLRYTRRQQSSEWLIRDARLAAGRAPVAEGVDATDDEWVRPLRPARCRWRVGADVTVHLGDDGRAHWGGIERCGSIWACPVCASVIRAQRADDIQKAVEGWQAQGGGLVFVTLTIRHKRTDALATGIDAVIRGFQRLQSGAPWGRFKERFGVRGVIRSTEVTLGENGWHPHIHALFFVDKPMSDADLTAWSSLMYGRWAGIVTKLGARLPSELRGIDVRSADADGRVVGQYLAKLQDEGHAAQKYGIGQEMARSDFKSGRAGGLTPFELLDYTSRQDDNDDEAARHLWVEYVHATRGRRAVTWSRGLRELCRVETPELTDEEIIEATEAAPVAFTVPGQVYDSIKNSPSVLAYVLELVERGDMDKAMVWLGGSRPDELVDTETGQVQPVAEIPVSLRVQLPPAKPVETPSRARARLALGLSPRGAA